jgi:hypothetical protein
MENNATLAPSVAPLSCANNKHIFEKKHIYSFNKTRE